MKGRQSLVISYALAAIFLLGSFAWYAYETSRGIERSLALEAQVLNGQFGRFLGEVGRLEAALSNYANDRNDETISRLEFAFDLAHARATNLARISLAYEDLPLEEISSTIQALDLIRTEVLEAENPTNRAFTRALKRLSTMERTIDLLYSRLNNFGIQTITLQSDQLRNHQIAVAIYLFLITSASGTILFLLARQRRSLLADHEKLEKRVADRTKDLEQEIRKHQEALARLEAVSEDAKNANRAKSEFLAKMSHELRTPLNAVIGITEMLEEEASEEGRKSDLEPLGRVRKAGRHLLAIINDILDLSKIEAGKMELHVETIKITPLSHEVVQTAMELAKANQNTLELICPEDAGTLNGDPTRVRQILLNLLSNACKFTSNGRVTLTVRREIAGTDPVVIFEVADTGIGISNTDLGNLFEDFTQSESPNRRRYGGTGLGLAITRKICAMMDGDVSVSSELGRGSTFTVRLPGN